MSSKWSPGGKTAITYKGKKYKRFRAGLGPRDKEIFGKNIKQEWGCDCAAPYGEYHDLGCDCEDCPICKRQLLSCGHKKLFEKK